MSTVCIPGYPGGGYSYNTEYVRGLNKEEQKPIRLPCWQIKDWGFSDPKTQEEGPNGSGVQNIWPGVPNS